MNTDTLRHAASRSHETAILLSLAADEIDSLRTKLGKLGGGISKKIDDVSEMLRESAGALSGAGE